MKAPIKVALATALVLSMTSSVSALTFGPEDPTFIASNFNDSSAQEIADALGVGVGVVGDLLYKGTPYPSGDELPEAGPFSGSYDISYEDDLTGFEITWIAGTPVAEASYLVAKDGNKHGHWIFDISQWNGTETITVTGLWPDGGSLSHASIWGTPPTNVPDGGTSLLLLGMAVSVIGLIRRRA